MNPNEKTLSVFETRVRQMILQFKQLQADNQRLEAQVAQMSQDIDSLNAKLTQADNDYRSLKMARMLEITDGNLDDAKARLSKLIRDVNKCIAILSDEQ